MYIGDKYMQLGWVDFSREDRDKVFDVINLLQDQGAVDELGIGIVRDAFANYFFPGTSTIQTRAKYYLIVPYLLKEAADGRYGKDINKILRRIDEEEKQCGIILLEKNPEADGIIGKRVLPKGWVSRKPSDIYWNGIRTIGIFNDKSLSIAEYLNISLHLRGQKMLQKFGNKGDDLEDSDRDDKDAGNMGNIQLWNLPVYKENWRESLEINLTFEEATFLKTMIKKNVPGTLYEYILTNHLDIDQYEDFGAIATALKDQVDAGTANILELAMEFNNLVYLARVRYNIILSDGNNGTANSEWEWLENDLKKRADVDLNAIFIKLGLSNSKTFHFLSMLKEYFMKGMIGEADKLIRNREIQLKGINRAKLNHSGEYNPNGWIGGGWLDYRFSDAKRIINDIYTGEANSRV